MQKDLSRKVGGEKQSEDVKDQKELKLLFADDMILYIENSEEYTGNSI